MLNLDTLHGIDRYKDSPELGNLVVENIYLWKKAGAKGKVVGSLPHGTEVELLDKDQVNKFMWCKVAGCKQRSMNKLTGWCRASLLKDAGESEFE